MTSVRLSMMLLFLTAVGGPSLCWAQAPSENREPADTAVVGPPSVVERVEGAFTDGDADRLLVPSADRVEISLFGTRTHYSSAQALYVMREFFRTHVPDHFEVVDIMETATTCFVEGTYQQARVAQRLNVYVRLGHIDEEAVWQLQVVSIESARE